MFCFLPRLLLLTFYDSSLLRPLFSAKEGFALVPPTQCEANRPSRSEEGKTIDHEIPARTESLAGTPHMGTTDAVKDNVYALTREAVNFFHEVEMSVIDWDATHVGNGRRRLR